MFGPQLFPTNIDPMEFGKNHDAVFTEHRVKVIKHHSYSPLHENFGNPTGFTMKHTPCKLITMCTLIACPTWSHANFHEKHRRIGKDYYEKHGKVYGFDDYYKELEPYEQNQIKIITMPHLHSVN